MNDSYHQLTRALAVALTAVAWATGGCDDDPDPVPPPSEPAAATSVERTDTGSSTSVDLEGWRIPRSTDLAAPSEELQRQHLTLSEPERFEECYTFLERSDQPRRRLPFSAAALDARLFGCDIPVAERTDDRLYLAYPVPDSTHEATDLRLSVYTTASEEGDSAEPSRDLLWSHRMDRRDHSNHFEAQLRESFVATLPPNAVCVGTLWSGTTQVNCLSYDGKTVEWAGDMNFWSSTPLVAANGGLVGTDISGMTRRYPFSGVEMDRRELPGRGGQSALYALAGDRLVYAPEPPMSDDTYDLTLSAWRLDTFELVWRRKLPARLDPGVHELSFPPYTLIKIGQDLIAVDLNTGDPVWAVRVGSDRPKVVRDGDTLYMLIRRRKTSNLLYALSVKTGEVDWYARTPAGLLDVGMVGDDIALKSIRAVERITEIGEVPENAPPINSTAPDRRTGGPVPDDPATSSPDTGAQPDASDDAAK
jgi:outer membrane protein assembly factor BamB